MIIVRALLLVLISAFFLSGCGDNGPWPTVMGRISGDYTLSLPGNWKSESDGLLSILMSSLMADDKVIEHMIINSDRSADQYPTIMIIGSNRGGPYSVEKIREQSSRYLSRPVKNTPVKVEHQLDLERGQFTSKSYHEKTVIRMDRIYTKKGYIEALVACQLDDQQTIDDMNAIIEGILINPEIVYN